MDKVTFLTNIDEQRITAGAIAAPATAEVGQVLTVKSVDANDKPTEWGATNLPESVIVPNTLPNPHKLTFTGAVSAEYDGSEVVSVNIPENKFNGIPTPTTAEVGQIIVVKAIDENGKPTEWEAVNLPSGGSIWMLPFELMGVATLQEDCQRWVITQTDDSTTFEGKHYKAIKFITTTYASEDTTASNANGNVWINHPGGGLNMVGTNMIHSGAARTQTFYGEDNGSRYMKQLGNYNEKLITGGSGYIQQIVIEPNDTSHKLGAGSTVEVWGLK